MWRYSAECRDAVASCAGTAATKAAAYNFIKLNVLRQLMKPPFQPCNVHYTLRINPSSFVYSLPVTHNAPLEICLSQSGRRKASAPASPLWHNAYTHGRVVAEWCKPSRRAAMHTDWEMQTNSPRTLRQKGSSKKSTKHFYSFWVEWNINLVLSHTHTQ